MTNYKSIKNKTVAAEIVISKSRFLAVACGVSNTQQAMELVEEISKKHYSATHSCYAYRLTDAQKFSDDGEPQGTAGIPILECIKSKGLTNVIVVVTRYYGGIKLGAGGLVRAYTEAAAAVLDLAEKIDFKLCVQAKFTVSYQQMSSLNSLLHKYAKKTTTEYNGQVKCAVLVEKENFSQFAAAFAEFTQGQVELVRAGEVFEEF